MRIGVGGGLGPVRGGISNKGLGGGVGPVSAGTSWRGRSSSTSNDDDVENGVILALVLLGFAVVAPYFLGTWVAVELGASNPSSARTATGWAFESVAVITALWLAVHFIRRRVRRKRAEREVQEALAQERQEVHQQLLGIRDRMRSPSLVDMAERPSFPWRHTVPPEETILFLIEGIQVSLNRFESASEADIAFTSRSVIVHWPNTKKIALPWADRTRKFDSSWIRATQDHPSGQVRLESQQLPGGLLCDGGAPASNDLIRVLVDWSKAVSSNAQVPQSTFNLLDSVIDATIW